MSVASEFFAPWEPSGGGPSDWRSMMDEVNELLDFVGPNRTIAWRGLSDAGYSTHSTLDRYLRARFGEVTEAHQVKFENSLLDIARTRWRFDDRPALELLGQLQHLGAPTRLLDVTFNPLIALWFSVEPKYSADGHQRADIDGRLIAFDVSGRQISLDDTWGRRDLPWDPEPSNWRDGLPLVWRPPSYNDRIPAQDSGFLIGGIPGSKNADWYRLRPGDGTGMSRWSIDQVRSVTSVPLRMYSLTSRALQPNSTPTLTLRVPAVAKPVIRRTLDRNFGINTASVYPDLYGLAGRGHFEVPQD